METVFRDYSPQGVHFYYVYKALAHPELNDYITPFTLEERLMHVEEAKRTLGTGIPWLADNMDNDLKRALGDVPNAELVVSPDGRVATRRAWSDPTALRRDLEELVGPVDNPTAVSDLDMKTASPPAPTVATGVVPGVEVPGRMQPLRVEPVLDGNELPFYVKLRVEADHGVLRDGEGTLHVGFRLDPLYEVHWNNLAPPLEFEVTAPKGIKVDPTNNVAPKPEVEADADPREFLVAISSTRNPSEGIDPLELTVLYYACDNANTWCIPVTQSYELHVERDPDGGRVFGRGSGGRMMGAPRGDRRGSGQGGGPEAMIERILRWDANGDGLIVRDEVPERMRERFFDRADANGDGVIDADELEEMAARMQQMRRRQD